MHLRDYFENEFWNDIRLIPVLKPNETILNNPSSFFLHPQILFFGGDKWETYSNDILRITEDKRENFINALLVISTIDYFIKNNIDLYRTIRQIYDPPKLGRSGFGPHFEHPYHIIKKHYNNNIDSLIESKNEIQDLFYQIINQHEKLDSSSFIISIIENKTEIPEEFNKPVYFNFLIEDEKKEWSTLMAELLCD